MRVRRSFNDEFKAKIVETIAKGEAPQAPRYTSLKKLLSAKTISELWN